MRFFGAFALVCVLLFSAGCSTKGTSDRRSDEKHFFDPLFGGNPYQKAWDKNTKLDYSQSSFETVMRAEVTYWNLPLREAYINEMTSSYRLPQAEQQALRLEEYTEDENYVTFIVSLTTKHLKHNDLDRSNSVWRILLENTDATIQVKASSVDKVDPKNERLRYFYRSMNEFNKTYKVRFPRRKFKDMSEAVLVITGPIGSVSFKYPLAQKAS